MTANGMFFWPFAINKGLHRGLAKGRLVLSLSFPKNRYPFRMSERLFFDELEIGNRWISQARTITETDVVNFACLTGDFDPLHVDHEHAAETPFGKPIAHGLLGLSLLAGLSSQNPAVQTVAFLGIRDWEFHKPIYFGDTIHAVTEVEDLQPKGRRTGLVRWRRELVNQNGDVVQSGILETLVSTSVTKRASTSQRIGKVEAESAVSASPARPR